jgi:hypothetical protein
MYQSKPPFSIENISKNHDIGLSQGDKIGRIFAEWLIVSFGQLRENYRITQTTFSGYLIERFTYIGMH